MTPREAADRKPSGEPDSPTENERDDSRLAILQEITLALNSTLDPRKLIDLLLDSCIRYTSATTGSTTLASTSQIVAIPSLEAPPTSLCSESPMCATRFGSTARVLAAS